MKTFGFVIRRVARSFGIKNEMNRRMAITRELQLLAEAESILGRLAWSDSENIQEIAEEFYQIRELEAEAKELRAEIREFEIENERLLAEQEELEGSLESQMSSLSASKTKAMQRTISLMNEIENLKIDAEITRKKFSGVKLRLKSLASNGASEEELADVRENLEKLKNEYAAETKRMVDRQASVKACDDEIAEREEQIAATREQARDRITILMNEVGRSSNLVARYGAKLGAVEKRISDLTFEVGTFLSHNTDNPTPEVRRVINKHRHIISKLTALKSSIRFNKILAGQSLK